MIIALLVTLIVLAIANILLMFSLANHLDRKYQALASAVSAMGEVIHSNVRE